MQGVERIIAQLNDNITLASRPNHTITSLSPTNVHVMSLSRIPNTASIHTQLNDKCAT